MKYLVKLMFCILCVTLWSGCTKDDDDHVDLENISLPADYFNQTIWRGHFEPSISDDPQKSEITILFTDRGGNYRFGEKSEGTFLYWVNGRTINIDAGTDIMTGVWWIISLSKKRMVISEDPAAPNPTKIILNRIL